MTTNTVEYEVGHCPACRKPLLAELDLVANIGKPYLSGNKPSANWKAAHTGLRLHHECGPDDQPKIVDPADLLKAFFGPPGGGGSKVSGHIEGVSDEKAQAVAERVATERVS